MKNLLGVYLYLFCKSKLITIVYILNQNLKKLIALEYL